LTRQLRVSFGLFHTGMTTSMIASVITSPSTGWQGQLKKY
jgi:hypothetical protein